MEKKQECLTLAVGVCAFEVATCCYAADNKLRKTKRRRRRKKKTHTAFLENKIRITRQGLHNPHCCSKVVEANSRRLATQQAPRPSMSPPASADGGLVQIGYDYVQVQQSVKRAVGTQDKKRSRLTNERTNEKIHELNTGSL